jgi:hypothetical protein
LACSSLLWSPLVTSTYHARRAALQLSRCFDGDLTFVPAAPRQPWWRTWMQAVRVQLGYVDALVRTRAC